MSDTRQVTVWDIEFEVHGCTFSPADSATGLGASVGWSGIYLPGSTVDLNEVLSDSVTMDIDEALHEQFTEEQEDRPSSGDDQ